MGDCLGKQDVAAFFGPMVKRLRHRPFTAVTRVRFPVGSPEEDLIFFTKVRSLFIWNMLCFEEDNYEIYLCDKHNYDMEFIVSSGGYCTVTGLFYYDDYGNPFIDVDGIDFECN